MPELSQRSLAMPASPIRRLAPFAEAAAARGTRIFHLNIGQPDVDSPREFWDAVRDTGLQVLEYSHSAGLTRLREKAAASYCRMGIEVGPDQVIVTTAGSEALGFALLTCLDPGDEVIVPEPLYANYRSFATAAGVRVVAIPTSIETGFMLPGVEEFAARITPRTKAVLVCNPGNPTGTVYHEDALDELRALALRHDLFLIADEVYREFNYTGRPLKSVLRLEGLERHAVMCDSVSKRFSLCGARIGFLVSRNDEVNAQAVKFAQARLCPPTLDQIGVLAALDAPDAYFEAVRVEYQARRDLVVERLRAMPGALCPEIEGAFYAMVRLPIDDSDRFCRWLLEEFSHEGQTVWLSPGTGFYETPGRGRDEVRIAYVLNREKLGRAMDCLDAALALYPGRTVAAGASA